MNCFVRVGATVQSAGYLFYLWKISPTAHSFHWTTEINRKYSVSAYNVKLNAGEELEKAALFRRFLEHVLVSTQNNEPKEKFSKPSCRGRARAEQVHFFIW